MLGCTVNSSEDELAFEEAVSTSADAQTGGERCAAMKVHEEKLKENPGLLKKMEEIEAHTQRFVLAQENKTGKTGEKSGAITYAVNDASATIEIPVVVNVLYNTTQQNITLDQINSQIEVLNKDFRAQNADLNTTTAFSTVKSDLNYHFTLKNVVRKATSKTSWGTRDAMKSSKKGGIDPTSPTTTLNIWVCEIGGGILGYAQFPGGAASTDGVVIGPQYFGDRGYLAAPYNKGRTATHEVGHWMNLRHIWGDATCGSDLVNDTPTHNTANYGCPGAGHQSTCAGAPVEMTMNYMDYTDDACMYMFSAGQKARSRAIFASGGPRASFYAAVAQ